MEPFEYTTRRPSPEFGGATRGDGAWGVATVAGGGKVGAIWAVVPLVAGAIVVPGTVVDGSAAPTCIAEAVSHNPDRMPRIAVMEMNRLIAAKPIRAVRLVPG
jgi:hypothetical protein